MNGYSSSKKQLRKKLNANVSQLQETLYTEGPGTPVPNVIETRRREIPPTQYYNTYPQEGLSNRGFTW